MDNQTLKISNSGKMFRLPTLILFLVGLGVNIALSKLVLALKIPLFLDSIGTVMVSSVCGLLPGMAVGFLTNCINSIGDPITMYYGILNVLIAVVSYLMSKAGLMRKVWGALVALVVFAFIGGGIGSLMTWMLYGFNFGSGISAPFAHALFNLGTLSQFGSQLTADVLIDFADKFITVALVFVMLKLYPQKLTDKFQLGYIYAKENRGVDYSKVQREKTSLRKHPLRVKIVCLIVATASVLSVLSVAIGLVIYRDKIQDRYESICTSAVNVVRNTIDADRIQPYLDGGTENEAYLADESELNTVFRSFADIKYIYVYQIREDGCHVVFDLDTEGLPGEELGTVIEFDKSFLPYKSALLAGEEIAPIVSNDQYGWLLTIYKPLKDSNGNCVAYAAADVDMKQLSTDSYVFFIRVAALLFGVSMLIVAFALWYAEKRISNPLNTLMVQAKEFAYADAQSIAHNAESIKNGVIKTGDEIEELSVALAKTATEILGYIDDVTKKSEVINRMQLNTIRCFADMVESRDSTTGDHIQRTSDYVRILGEGLLERGCYPEIVNRDYIEQLVLSAPLHDIGKIGISDSILNKPGKLTTEEFDTMKNHTSIGRGIIKTALTGIEDGGYLQIAEEMAAYHHEKWDGSGYLAGLKGNDIPLCARIMAVADVFDALLSKRSYKEPFSFEKSFDIITESSGTHFDPTIIEVFIAKKDELKKESE